MKKIFCVGVVLACVACQATDKNTTETKSLPVTPVETKSAPIQDKTPEQIKYVALWIDSVFYRSPSEDAEKVALSPTKREFPPNDLWVMRLHKEEGEFFEVEPLTTEQRTEQCRYLYTYGTNSGFLNFGVRLFVKKSDAVPVLSRPVTFSYPDKTSITLQEGALAQAKGSKGNYMLSDGLHVVESSVEAESISLWFSISSKRLKDRFSLFEQVKKAPVTIGDKKILRIIENLHGETIETKGEESLFAFGTACSEFYVRLPKSEIQEPDSIFGKLMGGLSDPPRVKVANSATVYWKDGNKAGTTKAELRLEMEQATSITAEKACFNVPLDGSFKTPEPSNIKKSFELCFDAKEGSKDIKIE